MKTIKPRISVEYAQNATIVTFTDEKILEEYDIGALQESVVSVIESASGGIISIYVADPPQGDLEQTTLASEPSGGKPTLEH